MTHHYMIRGQMLFFEIIYDIVFSQQPPAPLCGAGGASACAGGMEGAGAVRRGRHAPCPLAAQVAVHHLCISARCAGGAACCAGGAGAVRRGRHAPCPLAAQGAVSQCPKHVNTTLFDMVSYPVKYHINLYWASPFDGYINYYTLCWFLFSHWCDWLWFYIYTGIFHRYSPVWKIVNWKPISASIADSIKIFIFSNSTCNVTLGSGISFGTPPWFFSFGHKYKDLTTLIFASGSDRYYV